MLYPQRNVCRDLVDCSGLWRFRADPDGVGFTEGWSTGFESDMVCAVPGSWNEQLQEYGLMNYVGGAWYQMDIFVPVHFADRSVRLRVGSADFQAKVWVNGTLVAENDILSLPFEAMVEDNIAPGNKARIVIWVSNALWPDAITPSVTLDTYVREERIRDEQFPATRPDFFPFGGIQRPVLLEAMNAVHIDDLTVTTEIDGTTGVVSAEAAVSAPDGTLFRVSLPGGEVAETAVWSGKAMVTLRIGNCRFWSMTDPHLHALKAELWQASLLADQYELNIGVREVKVVGKRLYLNGEPVFLRGFGKHEDFPVHGRAVNQPLMVKDFGLMKWIGANSFRTSHYPYAEDILDYADRTGVLVISELPSVNLDFRIVSDATLDHHRRTLDRQIARDKNHPSVIMWSVANEPGYLGEAEYKSDKTHAYWKAVCDHTRALDVTRPITMANVGRIGHDDPAFHYVDVISINRYYGWYDMPGQLDRAGARLKAELDAIAADHDKPIMVLEFGADTVAGLHSTTDQLFTEEYQADFIETYCRIIEAHPNAIGTHVWNFADFRTSQHHRRVVLNLKGVFTRTRDPKRAAFKLREMWAVPYRDPAAGEGK